MPSANYFLLGKRLCNRAYAVPTFRVAYGRKPTSIVRVISNGVGRIDSQSPRVHRERDKYYRMTYRSIAILALSIIPLYLYFKFSEDKSKKRIEIVSRGTAGKSLVGGKFHLVGTDGIPVSDEDFKDHYKLIYFGYTYCPDICPQELEKTSEALNILYSNPEFQNVKIVPLFISCDPKRDSLKSIKEYLLDFHPSFIGLSGTPDQIKATAKTFRIYYSSPPQSVDEDDVDYIVDHSTFTYLMSPDMQYLTHFSINDTPKRVAEVITDAVKGINVSQF